MSKGEGAKVYDYLMTMHMGWCYGPVDRLNQLWIKDKRVFCGSISERRNICIDQPDLFGGDEKEGGVVGTIEYYPGTLTQTVSEEVGLRAGRTADRMPGYRGLAHMFFRGTSGLNQGFQWVTNNPYLPATKAHFTRIPRQLNAEHAVIWPFGTEDISDVDGDWTTPTTVTEDVVSYVIDKPFPVAVHASSPNFREYSVCAVGGELCDDGTEVAGTSDTAQNAFKLGWGGDILANVRGTPPSEMDIDEGAVDFVGELTITYSDGAPTQIVLAIETYEGVLNGEGTAWEATGTAIGAHEVDILTPAGAGVYTHTIEFRLPAGTRAIRFGGLVNYSPFTGSHSVDEQRMALTWPLVEASHCTVDEGGLETMPDANPAHIIYECMVNSDWGKAEDPIFIDTASFLAAAETLHGERFGLSLGWFKSDTIENFIQEILDHVKSFLYQHPTTGLWTMRLLRDDYDPETLAWLTPQNCTVKSPKRTVWGDTINEVVVTYTDPNTEEEATVARHNLANIAVQGTIISDPRNYYAIRNETLASIVAERDVVESGTPLWSAQIEVDRSFWSIEPGDCLRLFWPEEDIESMVVRVMSYDIGDPKSRKITLNVVEDIFGLEVLAFSPPQSSLHRDPRPLAETPAEFLIMPPPLPELLRFDTDTTFTDDRYPETPVMVMVPQTEERGIIDVEVRSPVTLVDGSSVASVSAVVPPVTNVLTTVAIPAEATTPFQRSLVTSLSRGTQTSGTLYVLGSTEANHEVVELISYDAATELWTVRRGVYDTVPRVWPVGTRLWLFPGQEHADGTVRQAESDESFWLLPRTARGRLNRSRAVRQEVAISPRLYQPFRPANCAVDGEGFMPVRYVAEPIPADITATWVPRNRWGEDAGTVAWDDVAVSPEAGQTVTIRVVSKTDGSELASYAGLSGVSQDIPTSVFSEEHPIADVQFWAVRDGFESLQFHAIEVTVMPEGWNEYWGLNWGGLRGATESLTPSDDPALIDLTYVPTGYTLSEGNTKFVQDTAGTDTRTWLVAEDPITPGEGRHYWEVAYDRTAGGDANGYLGVIQESLVADAFDAGANPVFEGAWAYRGSGTLWAYSATSEGAIQLMGGLPTYGDGDVVMLAFDASTGGLWIGVNGVWADHPDYASATLHIPVAYRGVNFRATLQGRTQGDGGTLAGDRTRFQYPRPESCRDLKTEVLNNNLTFSGTYEPPSGSDVNLIFQ